MVCIRFSAWSKTIECVDSKTSSVTSSASSPVFCEDLLARRRCAGRGTPAGSA